MFGFVCKQVDFFLFGNEFPYMYVNVWFCVQTSVSIYKMVGFELYQKILLSLLVISNSIWFDRINSKLKLKFLCLLDYFFPKKLLLI